MKMMVQQQVSLELHFFKAWATAYWRRVEIAFYEAGKRMMFWVGTEKSSWWTEHPFWLPHLIYLFYDENV